MNFIPRSAAEIATADLLPDGEYDYEVTSAEDAISKAGNEMVALVLKVFDGAGGSRSVRDWLVAGDSSIRKVRAFALSCGMLEQYDTGCLEAGALHGRAGRCKIKTDANTGFEPKNAVAYYLDPGKMDHAPAMTRRAPAQRAVVPAGAPAWDSGLDDEIPF